MNKRNGTIVLVALICLVTAFSVAVSTLGWFGALIALYVSGALVSVALMMGSTGGTFPKHKMRQIYITRALCVVFWFAFLPFILYGIFMYTK